MPTARFSPLSNRFGVHPNIITKWKRQALSGMKEIFSHGNPRLHLDHEAEVIRLQAKIGELVVEQDFYRKPSITERRPEANHD